jgi:hypothetical protein
VTSTAASIVQTKSLAKRMHPGGETASDNDGPQRSGHGAKHGPVKEQQQRGSSATPAATPAKSDIPDKKAGHWIGDTKDLQGVWMGRAPVRAEPRTADGSEDHEPQTPSKGNKQHHESKERGGHDSHHKGHHNSASKEKKPEPDTQAERPRSTEPTQEDQNSRNRRGKDQDKRGDGQDEGRPENKPDDGRSSGHKQSRGNGDNQERKTQDGEAEGRPDAQQSTQENHEQKRSHRHNRRRNRHSDEDSDGNDHFWDELISREVQRPVVDVEDDYLEMAVQVRTYGVTGICCRPSCLVHKSLVLYSGSSLAIRNC